MNVSIRTLRLGTRRSALALAQSAAVAAAVRTACGSPVKLIEITTYGDAAPGAIATLGGTGVFVSALREQLLAGEIDLAVHSYKDLPTAAETGLVIAAVPPRADPRDVLISRYGRSLADLPTGARVGTGSPRRTAQLLAARPDLDVVGLRGNVDTRIERVTGGLMDAVVLAQAGLARLGRLAEVSEVLDPMVMLPAPAQGALAVECRADDLALRELLAVLDDAPSSAAVTAERGLLAKLEAGCTAPVGALAEVIAAGRAGATATPDSTLRLRAMVAAVDGTHVLTHTLTGRLPDALYLGYRLADHLLAAGATDLLGVKDI
ncbi:MAG: hydroxymethylbilane synthase [Frankiaceae bacterium]